MLAALVHAGMMIAQKERATSIAAALTQALEYNCFMAGVLLRLCYCSRPLALSRATAADQASE